MAATLHSENLDDESDDGTLNLTEIETPKALERIERMLQEYEAGRKLFPRDVLEDLARQLDTGSKVVYADDFFGNRKEYKIKVPKSLAQDSYIPRIRYERIEGLLHLNPRELEEGFVTEDNPLSMCYSTSRKSSSPSPAQASEEFEKQQKAWLESQTRALLNKLLSSVLPLAIDKIVCFGLGSFWRSGGQLSPDSHWQHFAAQTMAKVLATTNSVGIPCYAQDPAYDSVDKELLRQLNIIPLEDPKGFLKVDSKTLVMSVHPNVPVKQIVTDIAWPAAMLWNTVKPEPKEKPKWRQEDLPGGKGMTWVHPYTTDPDSSRVRSMIENYKDYQFEDKENKFGDLTFYVKKGKVDL